MTREDIERMAVEAGFNQILATTTGADVWIDDGFYVEELKKFAVLVAAAEREACAKVCEELFQTTPPYTTYAEAAQDCAAAIRARGET